MRKRFVTIGVTAVVSIAMVVAAQAAFARLTRAGGVSAVTGKTVSSVRVLRTDTSFNRSSSTWVTVPGMATSVSVPSGAKAIIIVRVTSESSCVGGSSWCSARITVDGKNAQPYEGTDFALLGTGVTDYVGTAFDRSFGPVGSGSHKVILQINANGNGMRLDDESMTIEVVIV